MYELRRSEINEKRRMSKKDMMGYIVDYIDNAKNGYDVTEDICIDIIYKDGREERFSDREIKDMKRPNMAEVSNVIYSDGDIAFDLFTYNIMAEWEVEILEEIGFIIEDAAELAS